MIFPISGRTRRADLHERGESNSGNRWSTHLIHTRTPSHARSPTYRLSNSRDSIVYVLYLLQELSITWVQHVVNTQNQNEIVEQLSPPRRSSYLQTWLKRLRLGCVISPNAGLLWPRGGSKLIPYGNWSVRLGLEIRGCSKCNTKFRSLDVASRSRKDSRPGRAVAASVG